VQSLKTKLLWVEQWATSLTDKKRKKALRNIRYTMWRTIGEQKYGFVKKDLEAVIELHRRTETIPKGYLYPELHVQPVAPHELRIAMLRKWRVRGIEHKE